MTEKSFTCYLTKKWQKLYNWLQKEEGWDGHLTIYIHRMCMVSHYAHTANVA